jgi:hypothetical protein
LCRILLTGGLPRGLLLLLLQVPVDGDLLRSLRAVTQRHVAGSTQDVTAYCEALSGRFAALLDSGSLHQQLDSFLAGDTITLAAFQKQIALLQQHRLDVLDIDDHAHLALVQLDLAPARQFLLTQVRCALSPCRIPAAWIVSSLFHFPLPLPPSISAGSC